MENIALFELLAASPLAFVITTFCISLLVGSFLNVVIYRLPIMMEREWQRDIEQFQQPDKELPPAPKFNLVKPDSTCPNCQHKIRAWENIPVISWLMLGRKCSECANPISARYPAVELLTAVMSAVVAYQLGFGLTGAAFILGTWLLIAMTFIDLDKMLLPDSLTLLLLWIGLGISCFDSTISPIDSIIGAIIGYLILWSIYWAFKLLTGKEGMGYGDFKLLAALGAWVGWQHLPIIILLSSVVGAVVGISMMFIKKKDSNLAIPFGPYLAAAGWLTMLYGDLIANWYLSTL